MIRYTLLLTKVGNLLFPCLLTGTLLYTMAVSLAQQPSQSPAGLPAPGKTRASDIPGASRVYASGTVVMADATALPADLRVELVCHGRVMDEAPVSPQGGFTLEAGEDPFGASDLDASVQGHPNSPQIGIWEAPHDAPRAVSVLNGCQVRMAPTPELWSRDIPLDNRDLRANPDVGTLVVQRGSPGDQPTTINVSVLKAPPKARKAYEKAQKELAKEKVKYPKAIEYLEEATTEYPEYTDAWYLLGYCRQIDGDLAAARAAFEKTVQLDRIHKGASFELARYELDAGNWQEACKYTQLLLQLEPDTPQVLYLDGIAHFNSGQPEIAENSLQKLVNLGHSESYPMVFFYLAVINGEKQNYSVAADYYRTFLEVAPDESVPESLKLDVQSQLKMWQDRGLLDE